MLNSKNSNCARTRNANRKIRKSTAYTVESKRGRDDDNDDNNNNAERKKSTKIRANYAPIKFCLSYLAMNMKFSFLLTFIES